MYYKHRDRIYNREQLEGKTFSEEDKPEPVFEKKDMLHAMGYASALSGNIDEDMSVIREYFKQQFNISI
jgi:hypothetical protein